jgi:Ca2+-transporting ATPase
VRIVHSGVPGRARFAVSGLRRNTVLAVELERRLRGLPGIHDAQASPWTGNLLVRFDPRLTIEAVRACIEQSLGVSAATPPPRKAPRRGAVQTGIAHPSAIPVSESDWHTLELDEVLRRVDARLPEGLSATEVEARLRRHGGNRLEETPPRSPWGMALEQVASLPVALLGVSAAISLATGGRADAAIILGVVGINSVIGFFTERNAERTIRGLGRRRDHHCQVRRDGAEQGVPAEQVVPGDLVLLRQGSEVPADLRLFEAHNLSVDESALTGESLPVRKHTAALPLRELPLGDRSNMAYMGTAVTGGNAAGTVVATARETEIGRIQSLLGSTRPPETPMQRQLDRLGTQLALLSAGVCVAVFGIGLLRGQGLVPMLKGAVSLAVAAVPEGLPAVATTTLALGIQEMRRRHVAVRRLDAVETLGSVGVFCLDKTGTLTLNRMRVVALRTAEEHYTLEPLPPGQSRRATPIQDHPALRHLLQTLVLCNEASVGENGEQPDGSPTEAALIEVAAEYGVEITVLRQSRRRRRIHHRAEGRPYMQTLHELDDGELLAVKGSPAEVLAMCSHYETRSGPVPLTEEDRERFTRANDELAGEAMRVLAAARRVFPRGTDVALEGLVWQGLAGMADPLRPGMRELIESYHRAGIETVMITGDQGATAYAVGRSLALSGDRPLRILDAAKLEQIDDALLAGLVRNVHVFARVSPAHKLKIVRAFQQAGKVVAMTGDGINDGPALKAADIGVAMGKTGTDVARSVADVVLEDDNLQTMSVAIAQGRTIYDNIRKTIRFLLATNFSEIELMVAGLALGLGQPLNPMQLLWINLVTDIFPGLALSVEPAEPGVLERAPRPPFEPIVSRPALIRMGGESMAITSGALASYAYALLRHGPGPLAGTQAFTTLTLGQLLHALACRSEERGLMSKERLPRNPKLELALGLSVAAQLAAVYLPPLRRILGTQPLGVVDLGVALLGAVAPLVVNESFKEARHTRPAHQPAAAPQEV